MQAGTGAVVQSAQAYVTRTYVNPAVARADTQCMATASMKCREIGPWFETNRTRLESLRANAPQAANQDSSVRVTADRQWSISWDKTALDHPELGIPAVALTYIGQGSQFDRTVEQMQSLAARAQAASQLPGQDPGTTTPTNVPPPAPLPPRGRWVAIHNVGVSEWFFTRVIPATTPTSPSVGDVLRARTSVYIRPSLVDWTTHAETIKPQQLITVLEVRSLRAKGTQQIWIRFEPVD